MLPANARQRVAVEKRMLTWRMGLCAAVQPH
jgi:hypothetical protein